MTSRLAPAHASAFAHLVLPAPAQDPHVLCHGNAYYYCESSPSGIYVRRAPDFLAFGASPRQRVWSPPRDGPFSRNLWAPELHRIDGRFYIYFAADDGDNAHHRMWVLAATTDDPAGSYELAGALDTGGWAIDGTVFSDAAGRPFFLWSGWPADHDGQQNLYLAPLRSPVALATTRVLLAAPDQPWERHGLPLCEGPQILQRDGRTFVVYSASGSWTADYCLGLLALEGDDPMNASAWRKAGPVFSRNAHGWGVGHCGFATAADGAAWLLYHAKTSLRPGWNDREVRAQSFTWTPDGAPAFGEPLPVARRATTAASRLRLADDRVVLFPEIQMEKRQQA